MVLIVMTRCKSPEHTGEKGGRQGEEAVPQCGPAAPAVVCWRNRAQPKQLQQGLPARRGEEGSAKLE
jgi:hypothetical protein